MFLELTIVEGKSVLATSNGDILVFESWDSGRHIAPRPGFELPTTIFSQVLALQQIKPEMIKSQDYKGLHYTCPMRGAHSVLSGARLEKIIG